MGLKGFGPQPWRSGAIVLLAAAISFCLLTTPLGAAAMGGPELGCGDGSPQGATPAAPAPAAKAFADLAAIETRAAAGGVPDLAEKAPAVGEPEEIFPGLRPDPSQPRAPPSPSVSAG